LQDAFQNGIIRKIKLFKVFVYTIFLLILQIPSNPLMHFDVIWNLSSTGRQFNKDCDFVHAVAEEVIDNRRDALVILIK
jgi:hypothetical protein